MRSFLDTNVLVYLFDRDAPEKGARARELIEEETRSGRILLSTQVLQETFVAITRKFAVPIEGEIAEAALREFSRLPVVQVDPAMILDAARRSRHDSLSFWDSLILEAALAGDASLLFSEDMQDGRRFGTLEIRNPFR
jgi:predicted nucleic acid-binding protein